MVGETSEQRCGAVSCVASPQPGMDRPSQGDLCHCPRQNPQPAASANVSCEDAAWMLRLCVLKAQAGATTSDAEVFQDGQMRWLRNSAETTRGAHTLRGAVWDCMAPILVYMFPREKPLDMTLSTAVVGAQKSRDGRLHVMLYGFSRL